MNLTLNEPDEDGYVVLNDNHPLVKELHTKIQIHDFKLFSFLIYNNFSTLHKSNVKYLFGKFFDLDKLVKKYPELIEFFI
jgi:hypothetical protein